MSDSLSNRDGRAILHSAFAFVRSVEANKASAAVTLDHVLGQQVKFLKAGQTRPIVDATGASVGNRLSRYDELTNLQTQVDDLVNSAKGVTGEFSKT